MQGNDGANGSHKYKMWKTLHNKEWNKMNWNEKNVVDEDNN